MRNFILLLSIFASNFSLAQDWFQYDSDSQRYKIEGSDIHPAALFQKLSLYSGIEIQFEKSLHKGLHLDFEDAELKEIFRFIDGEFSTLKAYGKGKDGGVILLSLTILPKGEFQSSNLVLALDPVKEAVAHKQKASPITAQQTYVTRMEQLELKVRQHLDEVANRQIEESDQRRLKQDKKAKQKQQAKEKLLSELRHLKEEDPELYQRQLKIHGWKYPDLEEAVSKDDDAT